MEKRLSSSVKLVHFGVCETPGGSRVQMCPRKGSGLRVMGSQEVLIARGVLRKEQLSMTTTCA